MKIAFINSVAGFGSTGRIVYQLSKIPGVQGRIYYGRKDNMTDGDVCRITDQAGNICAFFRSFFLGEQGFANEKETRKMVENLREFNPDLIHLHNLHGFYINAGILFDYLKESGKPVIWTMHDCWAFTGHCAHYDSLNCDKWKRGCTHCPGLMTYPYTINGTSVRKNYEKKKNVFNELNPGQLTIVAPSFWLRDQLRQSFLKEQDIRTIHNGISLEQFHPVQSDFRTKHHLEGRTVFLAAASHWYKEKGLQDLAKLSTKLSDQQKLVVVGVTNRQKMDFSLEHTICIPRTNDIQELCAIYTAADMLIQPTYEDTFPTVNIEAQACGTPVLSYNTGGSPESLTKQTGIVIEKGNLDEMIRVLKQTTGGKSEEESRACIANARQYTTERMLNAYRALYEQKTGILL